MVQIRILHFSFFFFFNWTFLLREEFSLFIFHFSSIPFSCHCLFSFLLPENLLRKEKKGKLFFWQLQSWLKEAVGQTGTIPASTFEFLHSLGHHTFALERPALTSVPRGHREPCRREGEKQGTNGTSKFLGHVAKHLFIAGNNLTYSLIKVDLCDGYVIYIFLPLFLQDSGCIS